MKISIAQTKPIKGDISANIYKHLKFIELASSFEADVIFFPELSLTGYEPELAKDLATTQDDNRFDGFQKFSDEKNIIIGVGMPTIAETGIRISMIIFQPKKERITYSKQQLHADELPYFVNGNQQVIVTVADKKVALAICYESLQPNHAESASKLGADIYLASVAKSHQGVVKALAYYPNIAKKYSMPVLMSNCVGHCDNFLSVGTSSVWTKNGQIVAQLDNQNEGIVVFDIATEAVITRIL